MAQIRTSRVFDVIFLLLLGGFIWWAAINRVGIGDWIYFLNYEPDTKTVGVADAAGLSDKGRKLFYRTDPMYVNQDQIVNRCDVERLGCLDEKGNVYILDEAGQTDQTVVTAAHEMLHLAYRRMSASDKASLAPLLDQAITQNGPFGLDDELKDEKTDDDRRDEAHSLLGTEYRDLPDALEQYFAKYFSDRSKVVSAAESSK